MGRATRTLAVLFAINLLNYIDRYLLAGLLPLIGAEWPSLSKEQLGTLAPAFMIVYMLTSPVAGFLADRLPRRLILGAGAQLWSLATAAAALSRSFGALFATRALVGVGEASYGTTAPTLISDLYPREKRGRALSFFYIALPAGSALGYVLGGALGPPLGWRNAFLLVGLPGLAIGLAAYFLKEPQRGASEGVAEAALTRHLSGRARLKDYGRILASPAYVLCTLGMAAYTFVIGGISFWLPTFLSAERGMDLAAANAGLGLVTVVAGLSGTLAGGFLADRLHRRWRSAYLLVPAAGMVLAAPCFTLALLHPSPSVFWPALFATELLFFLNIGPTNTVLVNVTDPKVRASAFALNLFLIHALGDVISPPIMGRIADASSLGTAFLATGALVVVAAVLWFAAAPFLGRDTDRVAERIAAGGGTTAS